METKYRLRLLEEIVENDKRCARERDRDLQHMFIDHIESETKTIRKLAREEAQKVLAGAADPPWQPSVEQINAWYGQEFISVEKLTEWLDGQIRAERAEHGLDDGTRWAISNGKMQAYYRVKDFIKEK